MVVGVVIFLCILQKDEIWKGVHVSVFDLWSAKSE